MFEVRKKQNGLGHSLPMPTLWKAIWWVLWGEKKATFLIGSSPGGESFSLGARSTGTEEWSKYWNYLNFIWNIIFYRNIISYFIGNKRARNPLGLSLSLDVWNELKYALVQNMLWEASKISVVMLNIIEWWWNKCCFISLAK